MMKFAFAIFCLVGCLTSFAADEAQTEVKTPTFPIPKPVEAKENYRFHVGILPGINMAEGTRGPTPELGFDIGYQPFIPYGVGLELSTSKFDGADTEMNRRTTLLAKTSYNFGGDLPVIKYSYVGVAAGPVFLNDGTEMGFAPLMGFDVPLGADIHELFSLGFYAKYLFVTSKDPDSLITSAAIKFWY